MESIPLTLTSSHHTHQGFNNNRQPMQLSPKQPATTKRSIILMTDEPIFMRQPEGFVTKGKENHVCLLQKSLYGLKEAPRQWYSKLDSVLCEFGLKNCAADKCIYIRRTPEEFTIVIAHVDDSFAARNNKTVLQKNGTHLGDNFKVNVPPTRYICLNILRDRTTKRTQSHMISKISQRFGMSNLFLRSVPADPTIHLTTNTQPKSEGDKIASLYPFKRSRRRSCVSCTNDPA